MNERDSSAWRTRLGSSLAVPEVLPTNVIGGPVRSTVVTSLLNIGLMPSFSKRPLATSPRWKGVSTFWSSGTVWLRT